MHIPIVVSLLAILVAMVPSVGVSLIATRGRKSSGGNDEPDEANVGSDWGISSSQVVQRGGHARLTPAARRRE